ncbi:MAG TPA: cytochrome c3 family protein [Pirellulaceae bacterium]|nr:cytochrome c3 family protein [Pirellulaceae bacterium]HMO92390.1 cytochrome c3 family protein [Pirellulaceae bacterium]HMP69510.1 cytochrome c3 family protein [Pirellulaceae bacterium]
MEARLATLPSMRLRMPIAYLVALLAMSVSTVLSALIVGCDRSRASVETPTRGMNLQQINRLSSENPARAEQHPIQYSTPRTPRIETGQLDMLGNPITVSCASCHSNFVGRTPVASADELRSFHVGLSFQHGSLSDPLSCLTCHHAENYNFLRLADGRPLEFHDSRRLCAQCHAAKDRDYEHGAHGGMLGYWDRTRGMQTRKTCIDCHDPHAPQFPHMRPTFKPFDRFLESPPRHEQH